MKPRALLKLSSLLHSRNQLFQRTLPSENVRDTLREHSFISKAGISTARQDFPTDGKAQDRVYANYSIYKGKASLSTSPVLPKFTKLDSGSLKVDRLGVIMLSFATAIGERKYDWEKKQVFALSATEVGSLISLGPDEGCEFFHDPSMKSSNAGQVRKSLQVKPHADGSGYFINLTVADNLKKTNERFTVPVTKAEFAVMRTTFSFVLPHILGWDRYTNQHPNKIDDYLPKVDRQFKSLEWDR